MVECCLQAHFYGFFILLSYTTQNHLPRDGTTHSSLGLPHINHESRKCPTDMPIGQFGGGKSLIEVHSSQGTIVCVKLTKTNLHSHFYICPVLLLILTQRNFSSPLLRGRTDRSASVIGTLGSRQGLLDPSPINGWPNELS